MTKILVADDSQFMVETIRRLLRKVGHDARIVAYSGTEALVKWRLERPDLTLLDVHMPGLDGIEVLTQILEEAPGAKVVLVTADLHASLRDEATRRGAHAVIAKNKLAELERVVGNLTHSGVGS